jgi:HEAT repeat protein
MTDLASGETDVRRKAAEELGKMGPGADDALDALFAALEKDSDMKVRRQAALAIGQVAVTQPQITERLDKLASAERDNEVKAALFQAADSIREARKISRTDN